MAKSNSKLNQPRRIRIIPPLGKQATTLTDSRGKPMKVSRKGFTNHFKNIAIDGQQEDLMANPNLADEASECSTVGSDGVADGATDCCYCCVLVCIYVSIYLFSLLSSRAVELN